MACRPSKRPELPYDAGGPFDLLLNNLQLADHSLFLKFPFSEMIQFITDHQANIV